MSASIDALLHDTAAMLMTSYWLTKSNHGIKNELVILVVPREKYFLYHMITIYVFTKFLHLIFQMANQSIKVNRFLNDFDNFLNGPCAMRITTNLYRIVLDTVNNLN